MKQLQQGDVLMLRVDGMPPGATPVEPGARGNVLAEGEATGHAHAVPAAHATMWRSGEKLFLNVTAHTAVTHQEHKPVELEPGIWEIGRVREWDYLSDMARTVAD